MIRKFEARDLAAVMQIWLHGNLDAHAFIPVSFWTDHFETVRDMLPQAELYVHEDKDTRQIDGFIGLTESHIEGVFVAKSARSKGIGKALLDHAKSFKPSLTLSVYRKNERALAFYRRHSFTPTGKREFEEGTTEYIVEFRKKTDGERRTENSDQRI